MTRVIFAKEEPNGDLRYIDSKGERTRDSAMTFDKLEVGEYYLYVEIDWNDNTLEREFVISTYGVEDVFFVGDYNERFG